MLNPNQPEIPLDHVAQGATGRFPLGQAACQTEQRYRTLLDNLPTAVFTCDANGLITYFNQKAAEIWGRSPKLNDPAERFSGAHKLYVTDGSALLHDQSWMARGVLEQKAIAGRELIIETPSGDRRIVQVDVHPFIAEDGTPRGAIAVLVDMTNQRRAERELRESERFARSVVNSLAAHIAILDVNGTILAVNSAWKRFADENGMSSDKYAVGANYLLACDGASWDDAPIGRAAAAGIRAVLAAETSDFYLEYPCHYSTRERWFAMRVMPFEGDGPTRAVVSHENITARKLAERLASEQRGLRDAVVGMEQVLGVVGHELRTPLAALRAITEFLAIDGGRSTAEADRFLLEMSQEVDHMSDTVNNLLEAARLNSGRAKWNWSEVDLIETAWDAIASIQPLVNEHNLQIVNQIDVRDSRMLGDADALRRLLVNLLGNAKKHTVEGRIEVRAASFADPEGAWVDLSVRDTGAGIAPELLSRLGEAFALNSGVVGSNYIGGTGLGLAICKGIAAAHGGELLIDSVPGQGTTVTARLRADLGAAATGDTIATDSGEAVSA